MRRNVDKKEVCKVVISCLQGEASSFAIQMYEMTEKKGWPKWGSTSVNTETVVSLTFSIEEQFAHIKHLEEALARLKEYCQGEEDTDVFLTNFQNIKVKAKTTDDFA